MLPWRCRRRLLLAVTGGIAAYKTPDLVRALRKADCDVEVVVSSAAATMVSPLVLSTLAGRRCWVEEDLLSPEEGWKIPHISLADWAEAVLVAPCTASMLHKAASGAADGLIAASLLATRAPVLLFPAMNVKMWDHPATAANVEKCRDLGYGIIDPEAGFLACGYEGKGRLPDTEVIVETLWKALAPKKDLAGKKVLVTAGPTWEFIDPVRYIGNPSTGRMGFAVAKTAWYRGAEVTVVAGPTTAEIPPGVHLCPVTSALEMRQAVLERFGTADIVVKAAAVGDFRVDERASNKIKRGDREWLDLRLVQNPDIVAELGDRKKPGQLLVGFAAETESLDLHARAKMERKKLDAIVANDVTAPGAGFSSVDNRVVIYDRCGARLERSGSKEEVAWALWDHLEVLRGL